LKRINGDYSYSVPDQERILAGHDLQAKLHIYLKLQSRFQDQAQLMIQKLKEKFE
jgi:hypothetical protein